MYVLVADVTFWRSESSTHNHAAVRNRLHPSAKSVAVSTTEDRDRSALDNPFYLA